MMLDTILRLVKASGADAWEVTESVTEGWEFYFIKHRLDQNRAKKTTHTTVRLFRTLSDGKGIGSASEEIPPTETEEETEKRIRELMKRASYAENPYYTLRKKDGRTQGAIAELPDVEKMAGDFLETMREIPENEVTDLNSYEIFADVSRIRFLNSEGIDLTYVRPSSMLEVVVNARNKEHEIELYRIYRSGGCDRDSIRKALAETMQFGRDRLEAVPMPKLVSSPVVFSTEETREIGSFFINRMLASYKVRGYSDWEIGKPVFDGRMETPVTVEALKELPNSSGNAAYDAEGAPVRDAVLIDRGVPKQFVGDRQFSCYLGLEDSFIPGNFRISGGLCDAGELRTGDFLEAVEFSDFQVDPLSGNLGGEIRLAYWHHDGIVTPVTGGSISGSMLSLAPAMKMSKELRQYNNMELPAVIRLEQVSVTGITQI